MTQAKADGGRTALPKCSEREMKCLAVLHDGFPFPEQCVFFYDHITSYSGLSLPQARRAVRALKRKGLADLSPCFDDEGLIRGTGYFCTALGDKVCRAVTRLEGDGGAS